MTADMLVGKASELAAATLPRRKFTREEYYRMAEAGILREDERTELIEGEIRNDGSDRSRTCDPDDGTA
jgi:hypothetical protein